MSSRVTAEPGSGLPCSGARKAGPNQNRGQVFHVPARVTAPGLAGEVCRFRTGPSTWVVSTVSRIYRESMSRPPRIEVANGIYHVVARGNERRLIFVDDIDRERFLELLGGVAERYRWLVLSYCLMGNHYHVLVQTIGPNLARGMRQLNGVYAQWFNRRHVRVGHLFEGRYKAVLVQEGEHFERALRYVVRNPVRAGLTRCVDEWRWTSHGAMVGAAREGVVPVVEVLSAPGAGSAQRSPPIRNDREHRSRSAGRASPAHRGRRLVRRCPALSGSSVSRVPARVRRAAPTALAAISSRVVTTSPPCSTPMRSTDTACGRLRPT